MKIFLTADLHLFDEDIAWARGFDDIKTYCTLSSESSLVRNLKQIQPQLNTLPLNYCGYFLPTNAGVG